MIAAACVYEIHCTRRIPDAVERAVAVLEEHGYRRAATWSWQEGTYYATRSRVVWREPEDTEYHELEPEAARNRTALRRSYRRWCEAQRELFN